MATERWHVVAIETSSGRTDWYVVTLPSSSVYPTNEAAWREADRRNRERDWS
jgi:hypothetical protein